MTVSYPIGGACADVVASGATLRGAPKPSKAAGVDCAVGSRWS